MSAQPSVLITGANRGIGLEFVRQYTARDWHVFATCRRPDRADDLRQLGRRTDRIEVLQLDVGSPESIDDLADRIRGRPIDLLLHNAAMKGTEAGFAGIEISRWIEMMRVNAIGPVLLTRALCEELSLAAEPKVVGISSMKASITRNRVGGSYEYRSSKAALNAALKSLAIDLRDRGITCVSLSPGWVHEGEVFAAQHLEFGDRLRVGRAFRAEFGASSKRISVEYSVASMIDVISGVSIERSGRLFDHEGTEFEW
jgi:NAD(P)-dependent dehydrogenase (short-subunit alcohol dehydrogenase family)